MRGEASAAPVHSTEDMQQQEIEWRTPLDAFAPLAARDGAVLLHGGARANEAHWSFIAAGSARTIRLSNGATLIDGEDSLRSPFEALADVHARRRTAAEIACGSPFASGLVGFVGYECGRLVEPSAKGPSSHYALPDFWFRAYDAVAAFDRRSRRAFVLGRGRAAVERLESALGRARECEHVKQFEFSAAASNFTETAYRRAVAEIIERIAAGDLFQANLSQQIRLISLTPFDPYAYFVAMSCESSAAFGAYLNCGGAQILSFSPERFFSVTRREAGRLSILAEPIKGTRPRGATPEADARLLAELAADEKERAENVMIADLTRNDLSKICEDRSIREEAICEPVSHQGVHHLVSRISGSLRSDVSAADALTALFPCGSVTGAPKVEAMKTIAEIEPTGRGPYCGAIGWLDDRGGADFSVAIRIAVVEGARISIPVGGGVTLRSDPVAEYEETIAKARPLLRALGREGLDRA